MGGWWAGYFSLFSEATFCPNYPLRTTSYERENC